MLAEVHHWSFLSIPKRSLRHFELPILLRACLTCISLVCSPINNLLDDHQSNTKIQVSEKGRATSFGKMSTYQRITILLMTTKRISFPLSFLSTISRRNNSLVWSTSFFMRLNPTQTRDIASCQKGKKSFTFQKAALLRDWLRNTG